MGCWNETCGLSRLHISAGADVLVFTLEEHTNDHRDRCYSTALFSPILLPFYSKYDDYGGAEYMARSIRASPLPYKVNITPFLVLSGKSRGTWKVEVQLFDLHS